MFFATKTMKNPSRNGVPKKPRKRITVDTKIDPKSSNFRLFWVRNRERLPPQVVFWVVYFWYVFWHGISAYFVRFGVPKWPPWQKQLYLFFGTFFDFFPTKCVVQFFVRFLASFGHKINQKCEKHEKHEKHDVSVTLRPVGEACLPGVRGFIMLVMFFIFSQLFSA